MKSIHNWDKIVSNMKNNLYTGKHLTNKKERESYNYDEDLESYRETTK